MKNQIRNWHKDIKYSTNQLTRFFTNIEKWINRGITLPEYCFLWYQDEQIIGGIIFINSATSEVSILDCIILSEYMDRCASFIKNTIEIAKGKEFYYHLYNDSEQYIKYKTAFLNAHFNIEQEKLSYKFTKPEIKEDITELEFKSYSDVGSQQFLTAFVSVTTNTLDRDDQKQIKLYGEIEAAKKYIQTLKEIDFQSNLWQLAYINDNLIGLVIAQNFDGNIGAINYIGVTTKMRGQGYVNSLIQRGTKLLLQQGIKKIIADIDVLNFPLKKALEQNNYQFATDMIVLAYNKE